MDCWFWHKREDKDEDDEIERARSITKAYGLCKLADDLIALGTRASEVRVAVCTATIPGKWAVSKWLPSNLKFD